MYDFVSLHAISQNSYERVPLRSASHNKSYCEKLTSIVQRRLGYFDRISQKVEPKNSPNQSKIYLKITHKMQKTNLLCANRMMCGNSKPILL